LRGATIELANPPPNVTLFEGARPSAIAGDTIMLLDIDGDGRDELVVACPDDQPQGRVGAGDTFVFFGTSDPLPATIDLAAIPPQLTVLEFDGSEDSDMLAYSMGHGDLNGDGRPDLVLNAMGGDGFMNRLTDAGDAYVFDAVAVAQAVGREIVPTPTPTPTATGTPTATPSASPTATAPACAGDCDRSGTVSIDELIRAVAIALDNLALSTCTAADTDGNGTVEIAEIIAAVARSLSGC